MSFDFLSLFSRASGCITVFDAETNQQLTSDDPSALADFAASLPEPWIDLVTDRGEAIGAVLLGDGQVATPPPSATFDGGAIYLFEGDAVPDQEQGRHLCPLSAVSDAAEWRRYSADITVETPASKIEITLSTGAHRQERNGRWKATNATFSLLSDLLHDHKEGKKDGPCFLQGEAAGGARKSNAMIANYILGIDLDSGAPLDGVIDAIRREGLEAVIYTTHSHMKRDTAINRDHFLKWSDGQSPTVKSLRDYLTTVKAMRPEIVEQLEILDDAHHDENGISILVRHTPIPKFRVVFALHEPFIFAKRGGTQKDAMQEWKERYTGFCTALGLAFDQACADPARLYYYPRHPKDAAEFGTWRILGEPLDLDRYDRVKPQSDRKRSGSFHPANVFTDAAGDVSDGSRLVTPDGLDLRKWAACRASRFEIEILLTERLPDMLGDPRAGSQPGVHVACPFEAEHSTAGGNGTFVVNASDALEDGRSGFVFCCTHNACADRDRLDFLHALLADGQLSDADLTDPDFLFELEDDDDDDDGEARVVPAPGAPAPKGKHKGEAEHLAELNARYAVVKMKNAVRILCEPEASHETPDFLSEREFLCLEANRIVPIALKNGETRDLPMAKEWLKSPNRRTYAAVRFAPGQCPPDTYNLFRGWALDPKPGDWSLFRDHLLHVICRSNEELFLWLLTWLAHIFQCPQEKPGVAIVIRGEKGTGKSIIFDCLRMVMSRYLTTDADGKRLTGNFNAVLETTLLLGMEEAFWAGDKPRESILKELITGKTIQIERKGTDRGQANSYLRIAMVSNEAWVVPATGDERRYAFFDCDNRHRSDTGYFGRMMAQMQNDGAAAMLHDLLHFVPENGWSVVRTPPRTPALQEQVVESLRGVERFAYNPLVDGFYESDDLGDGVIQLSEDCETEIPMVDLRKGANDYLRDHHPSDRKADYNAIGKSCADWLGARMVDRLARADRKNKSRCVIFPPLARAREWVRQTKGIEVAPPTN